jgi:stalled ribosome rescue protein Dom34
MTHQHAIVWLDHHEAHVIGIGFDQVDTMIIQSERGTRQIHRKAKVIGSGKATVDHEFFDDVVHAVDGVREVLVVGPGTAKTEFVTDVGHRHTDLSKRIVGVETLDHPSDVELLDHGRKVFKRIDALKGDA